MPGFLQRLDPKQRKIALALGGAGLLALIAFISRGRGGAATAQQTTAATDGTQANTGYDFSGYNPLTGGGYGDSSGGGATSGLDTSQVNQSLSDLGTSLATLGDNQQSLMDQLVAVKDSQQPAINWDAVNATISANIAAAQAVEVPAVAATASAVATRKTAGKDSRAASAARGVHLQTGGVRAGLRFKTTVKDIRGRRRVVRQYETEAGKGDFTKGTQANIRDARSPSKSAPKTKQPARKPARKPAKKR